jgi:hypothetical protein
MSTSQTMEPTMAPTPIPDFLKNPKNVDWSRPNNETIESNIMSYKDFAPSTKPEAGASECAAPEQLKSSDIFATATDIATKMGADTQCIKSSQNSASTQSASKSFDERSALKTDFNASARAFVVSASVSASLHKQDSKTANEQQSGSSNNQNSYSAGCGSTLITANNVSQKKLAMQCVINNVSQNTSISVGATATITIHTRPLTDAEVASRSALEASNNRITQNSSNAVRDVMLAMMQKAKPDGTPFYTADDITKLMTPLTSFYEKQQDKMNAALESYRRDINIKDSEIKNVMLSSVKTFTELTTSAKSDLATLSASIQKDLTAQSIANDMGVSSQDPNVKSMASKACESTSSESSSSITNVLNSLKATADSSGKIDIYAAGIITLTNVKITNDVTINMATQAVMNQAVANSQSAAAQFMTDTGASQGAVNKVAGLETLQKALGTTISDAIAANQQAVINSQNVGRDQLLSHDDKVKSVVSSQNGAIGIGAILLILVFLYFFTGNRGGNVNRFRSYRFNRL